MRLCHALGALNRGPYSSKCSSKKDRGVRAILAIAAALALPAAAYGQHADWAWEVSRDAGATWEGGTVRVSDVQFSVLVRLTVAWSGVPDGYAFAGSQFDGIVVGLSGAGVSDFARDLVRPVPFDGGAQTLVATRFGDTIKIDDRRDTNAPGMGSRGVFPGQLVEAFSGGRFSTANPATIFQYELVLDGSSGTRRISDIPSPSGEDVMTIRIYTSPTGGQYMLRSGPFVSQIDRHDAFLEVAVPSPGGIFVLVAGAGSCLRRRRRDA
jgi:hypothetical protein